MKGRMSGRQMPRKGTGVLDLAGFPAGRLLPMNVKISAAKGLCP